MDPLMLASYFLKADRQERERRARLAIEEAGTGFRRAVARPLVAFAAVAVFALALDFLH